MKSWKNAWKYTNTRIAIQILNVIIVCMLVSQKKNENQLRDELKAKIKAIRSESQSKCFHMEMNAQLYKQPIFSNENFFCAIRVWKEKKQLNIWSELNANIIPWNIE